MKNTNTITKKIAAILAAAMMMTTAASIAASADNTDTANTTIAAQNERQLEKARDLGIDLLFTGIEEFVPGGKLLTPVLKLFTDNLLGKGDELLGHEYHGHVVHLHGAVQRFDGLLALVYAYALYACKAHTRKSIYIIAYQIESHHASACMIRNAIRKP